MYASVVSPAVVTIGLSSHHAVGAVEQAGSISWLDGTKGT